MKTQSRIHRRPKGNERLNYSEWCERYRDMSDPLNRGLAFALPMFEGSGTASVLDCSRVHHPITQVHAPAWIQLPSGIWCMDFDGTNDYLQCLAASCTDLDFTTQAFSGCVWLKRDTAPTWMWLFCRLNSGVAGWSFELQSCMIELRTATGAGTVTSRENTAIPTTWTLCGFSRAGTSGRIYRDGADTTTNAGTHLDPASVPAANLFVGQLYDTTSRYDGLMWNPRIWNRALSASEHKGLYERERGLFGV